MAPSSVVFKKIGKFHYVYVPARSRLGDAIIRAQSDTRHPIRQWFRDQGCLMPYYEPGEYLPNDRTHFLRMQVRDADIQMLFKLRFAADEHEVVEYDSYAAKGKYGLDVPNDSTRKGFRDKKICYYHTKRNKAGWFIAWHLNPRKYANGEHVAHFASRKKKLVIEWCIHHCKQR